MTDRPPKKLPCSEGRHTKEKLAQNVYMIIDKHENKEGKKSEAKREQAHGSTSIYVKLSVHLVFEHKRYPPDKSPFSSDSSSLFTMSNFSISARDWP